MLQSTENRHHDLLEILIAVAWIDGEIQAEERVFLEEIALEQNLISAAELENLLTQQQNYSAAKCYELLEQYLGATPNPADYDNLLTAVSKLIYSDDDIATEEAAILTRMQNLDPQNANNRSTLDRVIGKIQKLYQAGLQKSN
ncbi:MAG: TerB family tellurite resistance protein [Cyanobacteria bacterium P01_C01_bin.72]